MKCVGLTQSNICFAEIKMDLPRLRYAYRPSLRKLKES